MARYVLPMASRGANLARSSLARIGLLTTFWRRVGMEPRGSRSRRRSLVKGLVAVARPENDQAPDERLAAARRELGPAAQPGRLVFSALVRLPAGRATLRLESTGSIEEATLGEGQGEPAVEKGPDGLHRVEITVESKSKDEPLFLMFRVRTGQDPRPFELRASYRLAKDQTDNPLSRHQMILPSAPLPPAAAAEAPLVLPDLSGGDPARQEALLGRSSPVRAMPHASRAGGKGRARLDRDRQEGPR